MTRIITRRDFVRGAAVAGATTSLSQLIGCRASLLDFQAEFRGAVIQPEDAMYEQAHRIFNARFDRHPDLIVRPVDAEDVSTAVRFARAGGFVTAVRGGGHSYAGHSTCEGGLVIDLSQMKGLAERYESQRSRPLTRARVSADSFSRTSLIASHSASALADSEK